MVSVCCKVSARSQYLVGLLSLGWIADGYSITCQQKDRELTTIPKSRNNFKSFLTSDLMSAEIGKYLKETWDGEMVNGCQRFIIAVIPYKKLFKDK